MIRRSLLSALLLLLALPCGADAATIFWGGPNRLVRGDTDTNTVTEIVNPGAAYVSGVVVDSPAQTVYYTTDANGQIRRANFDGSGDVQIASGQSNARGITLQGNDLYFGYANSGGNGSVRVVDKGGLGTPSIVPGSAGGFPFNVAFDSAGNLYWSDNGSYAIKRMDVGSTTPTTIAYAASIPYGLEIANDQVYWTTNGNERIFRSDLDGSNETELYRVNGDTLRDLAIVGDDIFVSASLEGGRILRLNLDGSSAAPDVLFNNLGYGPQDIAAYSAVPEPGSALLGLLLLGGVCAGRRWS